MKKVLTGLILYGSVLTFFSGCGEQTRDIPQYSIEQFLKTVGYRGASFSPDQSKILVSSNATGVYNAYAVPVDGNPPIQLTQSDSNAVFSVGYFPEDERLLFSSDQGGNELNHLYVREPDGSIKDLTPGENLKAQFYGWSWDDQYFYAGTNERDRRYFDIYRYSTDDYERELIFQNDEGYIFSCISPDNQTIALEKVITRNNSDIYLFDLKTQKIRLITEHSGEVYHVATTFDPEGRYLYYLTDDGSEFRYLVRMDLTDMTGETIVKPDWDVQSAEISRNGSYLLVRINENSRRILRIYDPESLEPAVLPDLEADITYAVISRDESSIAFYASAAHMPSDLFYMSFADKEHRQLTHSLNPEIEPEHLVNGEVVRFESFDGVEIPGILYKPHQAGPDNKLPALVWVHGGPGGQSRIGYSSLIQYLVNHGYVIYAINNRGSSGYGKTFYKMDDRKHGEGDLDDCVSSKKMLYATGYVADGRIGIIGGSYGGYMVLAALTFRPEEFAVGIDLFGISNWYRTVQSIPPWWESIRASLETEMGDFDDEAYFRSISPLFHADQITKPLMVLQGANDPRVLQVESDEIVEAVKENGVPVEYIVFEDEGHGFLKNENRARGYQAILNFLERYLKQSI